MSAESDPKCDQATAAKPRPADIHQLLRWANIRKWASHLDPAPFDELLPIPSIFPIMLQDKYGMDGIRIR